MLAEQLLTFARDFIAEYQQYDVIGLIRATASILQRRANLNDGQYEQEAAPLRQKSNTIIAATKFNNYPTEWQRVILHSGFARFLPANAVKEVLDALPTNRNIAPQSSEMNLFETQCTITLATAQGFIPFAQKFDLSSIAIPKDALGVLVELPRRTFENEAGSFSETLKKFSDLVATLSEIVSGQRHAPRLLYASTSDPIAMLQTVLEVAAPILNLYIDMLEAIIKTLEIAKAFGIIREAGGSVSELPDITEQKLRTSISRLVDEHGKIRDEGRRKELHNELLLRVRDVMPTIREGGRLSIAATTNESTITRIVGDAGTIETLTRQSEITQTLEVKLENLAAEPALQIEHENGSLPP